MLSFHLVIAGGFIHEEENGAEWSPYSCKTSTWLKHQSLKHSAIDLVNDLFGSTYFLCRSPVAPVVSGGLWPSKRLNVEQV